MTHLGYQIPNFTYPGVDSAGLFDKVAAQATTIAAQAARIEKARKLIGAWNIASMTSGGTTDWTHMQSASKALLSTPPAGSKENDNG